MKHYFIPIILLLLIITACHNASSKNSINTINTQLPPGTIIVADSTRVVEDKLNDFYFSVKVLTNEYTSNGAYTVDAHFGAADAEGSFTMPKGGEHLKPMLRKGNGPYAYIVGFKWQQDTTFYDYFEVSATKGQIKMQYINSYTFQ